MRLRMDKNLEHSGAVHRAEANSVSIRWRAMTMEFALGADSYLFADRQIDVQSGNLPNEVIAPRPFATLFQ